jgi:hypothetical protein
MGIVTLHVGEGGGSARNSTIRWNTIGGGDVDVSQVIPITKQGQRYVQALSANLPPGASVLLAQLGYLQPPTAIDYEVWAEGTELQTGRRQLIED